MADMTVQQILEELEHTEWNFPREALEAAIEKQEEITPYLLDILTYAKENLEEIQEDPTYMGHFFAMYLLAQFREKRAYPLIYEFYAIPGEIPSDVTGALVTEDLGQILASVSHGDTSLMKALIEDQDVGEYVRGAGVDGIVTLVAQDMLPREEAIVYFRSLFHEKLLRDGEIVWSNLVANCADLHATELRAEIEQAYDDNLIDPFYIPWESVEEYFEQDREDVLTRTREYWNHTLIDDVIDELEGWACFNEPVTLSSPPVSPPLEPQKPQPDIGSQPASPPLPSAPEIAEERPPGAPRPAPPPTKVGRNDPCPCGSGKKYKYCCGSRR